MLWLMQEHLKKLVLLEVRRVVREHHEIVPHLANAAPKVFEARRVQSAGLLVPRRVVARVVRKDAVRMNETANVDETACVWPGHALERDPRNPARDGLRAGSFTTAEEATRQTEPEPMRTPNHGPRR